MRLGLIPYCGVCGGGGRQMHYFDTNTVNKSSTVNTVYSRSRRCEHLNRSERGGGGKIKYL
jgi:hypothetical protein